jgi:hypothetical protein
MLALGELQKNAGPDQCVTARANVLDANIANPQITGVWKSWEIKATAPPATSEYEKAARDAKFQGWLVSGTDPAKTEQIAYANESPSSPVTLWDKGSLGDNAPSHSLVHASKIPLVPATGAKPGATPAVTTGAMAWAVLDEGVKARINTRYVDDAASTGMKTAQLGAGERPGVEFMPGLKDLERKFFKQGAAESAAIDKGITRLNFALSGENLAPGKGVREALMPLTHDFTTQSFGLFTDTARGGLKQDFHLLTNTTSLPAVYSGKGVYVSRLGMTTANAPSALGILAAVRPPLSGHHQDLKLRWRACPQVPDTERLGGYDHLGHDHDFQPHTTARRGLATDDRESAGRLQLDRSRHLRLPSPPARSRNAHHPG